MRPCLTLAAVGLTAMFVSLPLSLSLSPSSSLPQLTVSKAEAWVTYRRARVTHRRAWRWGGHPVGVQSYGGSPNLYYGSGYYPYSGGQYGIFPNRGVGFGWGHRWGQGFGWGWHRGRRW